MSAMRFGLLVLGLAMALGGGARAGESGNEGTSHTTIVREANGVTAIAQPGNLANAEVHVQKIPSRTAVDRRSGGSIAIVTRSVGEIPPQDIPEWMRDLLRR
jgi:hypothetical protein